MRTILLVWAALEFFIFWMIAVVAWVMAAFVLVMAIFVWAVTHMGQPPLLETTHPLPSHKDLNCFCEFCFIFLRESPPVILSPYFSYFFPDFLSDLWR